MKEPMEPEDAWDKALEAAAEECLKTAPRNLLGEGSVGARTCHEIQEAILALRGKLNEQH